MSTTQGLVKGLKQMLKNRGSMTVNEVKLLSDVIFHLENHEKLKGDEKIRNGVTVLELLLRFLLNPAVTESITHLIANSIHNLH